MQTGISRLASLGYVHRGDLALRTKLSPIPMDCPCTVLVPAIALLSPTILRFGIIYALIKSGEEYGELQLQRFPHDIDGYIDGRTTCSDDALGDWFPARTTPEIERANRK